MQAPSGTPGCVKFSWNKTIIPAKFALPDEKPAQNPDISTIVDMPQGRMHERKMTGTPDGGA